MKQTRLVPFNIEKAKQGAKLLTEMDSMQGL